MWHPQKGEDIVWSAWKHAAAREGGQRLASVAEHHDSAILIDELTEFSESQIIYLMSRLRSDAESDSYMMATTNPDCDSWILKWVEWYLDEEGFPDKTKQGKVRYFYIVDDSPKFADTPEELMEAYPHLSHVVNPLTGEEVIIPPKTFAFIAGTI